MHGTEPYIDPGKVKVDNSDHLDIKRIGTFVTKTIETKTLMLHNLLYTPHITKNSVSDSQITKDNSVYFEFHETRCLVRGSVISMVRTQ